MDIIMPNKEGIETIMVIRRTDPETKFIAISGGNRTGQGNYLEMAEKLDATTSIKKRFRNRELLDVMKNAISN